MSEMLWYKRFHGTAYDPKFTVAGKEAGSTHCNALAVWDALLETTSENEEDRGSLAKVDFRVVAAGLHLLVDEVKRIWDAFVSLGMIAGQRVAKWAKRQGAAVAAAAQAAKAAGEEAAAAVSAAALRTRRWRQKKGRDPRQQEMFFVVPGGAEAAPQQHRDSVSPASPASPRRASQASHRVTTASPRDVTAGTEEEKTRLRDSPPGGSPPAGGSPPEFSINDWEMEVLAPDPFPNTGGRFYGPTRRRRRSPEQTLFDAAARLGAAMEREMALSRECGPLSSPGAELGAGAA